MPATPRWILAVPDAIQQLEARHGDVLTRRDVERLFRASRSRAARLMRVFGAELVGGALVVRRVDLLAYLQAVRDGEDFCRVQHRRSLAIEKIQRARLTGSENLKVKGLTKDVLVTRLAGLPEGVTVDPRRIEIVFATSDEALVRLVALAEAITHDLEPFQDLVDGKKGGAS